MLVIRPVEQGDLEALLGLSELSGYGLTTLPRDRELLTKRIRRSLRSFDMLDEQEPAGQNYLFVMEDLSAQRVVGTCSVIAKVGGFDPFYAYRIETSVHESKMLNVRKQIRTLHLVAEHNGPCELASLFLHPDYRRSGNGRTLSLSRFLFMAEHPAVFDPTVIAELRGVIDTRGQSPFWEAVGRHFFDLDLPRADYLSVVDKRFIADLMPRHPLYIPLLPVEAQAVIGQVHTDTLPALRLLQSEGFDFTGMVDIFEAGPIVSCRGEQIRTVRDSCRATVAGIRDEPLDSPVYLISNTHHGFRIAQSMLNVVGERQVQLPRCVAKALHVEPGQTVRYAALWPGQEKRRE